MTEAATHCPYCALQCGMTLRIGASGTLERRAPATSRPTAAGCARRAGPRPSCSTTPERLTTPLVRDARRASCARRRWDEALDRVADRLRELQADARPRRRRGVRRRRADQREGLPARQVRPGRAAHRRTSTTTAGSACRRRRPAGNRAFGVDRGLPFPLADLGSADVLLLVGAQPRRDDAAAHAAPRPSSASAAAADRRRPARGPPTARRADLHLQPTPGTDLALANGLLHLRRSPRAWSTSDVRRGAHHRLRRRRAGSSPPTGRSASSGSPACPCGELRERGRSCSADAADGHRPHRPRRRAARQGHRHRLGVHQPGARARPARPARLRLRLPHRPGQRPGRPRARPEGRPAARLPDDRRPGGPRARRRACGASTRTTCPAPGLSAVRAARRARHDRRAAGAAASSAPTRRLRPATPVTSRERLGGARPARGRRLRAHRDRRARRRRAAGRRSGPRRTAR